MIFVIFSVFLVLFLSRESFGWGLSTHIELAQSLLNEAIIIGGAVSSLILAHRKDFIIGNILADVIIGKKFSTRRKQSHHWPAGLRIMEGARDDSARAFAYGFLTHLAADTVAHNEFVPRQIVLANSTIAFGHLYWELRADQCVDLKLRNELPELLRYSADIYDRQLAENIYPHIKWFGFNRRMFSRVNRLAVGEKFGKAMNICENLSLWQLSQNYLSPYKAKSLERMTDILVNGWSSKVMLEDPNGTQAFKLLKLSPYRQYKS